MSRASPADQDQRDAVVRERERNVIVDAGAGTGKTTLVVQRLVEMIAPEDDTHAAVPLERIAAVTFTRKAAGELRLRVREGILRGLAERKTTHLRRQRFYDAIGAIDRAPIGTIHSFADRLLRIYPVESRLGPAYEIVEEPAELHREAFQRLVTGVERGTLRQELAGTGLEDRAQEIAGIVEDAIEAGVRVESRELAWGTLFGLDALVASLIDHRDVPPSDVVPRPFDRKAFEAVAKEFVGLARLSHGDGAGSRWVAMAARKLEALKNVPSVPEVYRTFVKSIAAGTNKLAKAADFGDDEAGYDAFKAFTGETRKKKTARDLGGDMRRTLDAWLAPRLVRLGPVAIALYERVKARRHAVDAVDLLLRLRDLLRDHRAVRAELQGMFDHVFVDEFQDTDPLQAEIMLFLAEDGARARDAWMGKVRPGKLTIVGDPKQSIYRFRRADVATYDRVRRKLGETGPLEAALSVNFRSSKGLVDWLNDRFESVLGTGSEGARFDVKTGAVFHAPLAPAPGAKAGGQGDVEIVPLARDEDNAEEARDIEAKALARYVQWLVEESACQIYDPLTEEERPVRYGDVAVLALITTNLPKLSREFDKRGVPYATSGGTLFLGDPLNRQFILALRAIADGQDGPAQAALLRPPLFAIDLGDLAAARATKDEGSVDERVQRVRDAQAIVTELRMERAMRSPGATARDLIEKTALGRTVAAGPNGKQRLERLRELCIELDAIASADGLDFDGATDQMRSWIDAPAAIEPPRPVDDGAVRVTTVHQAKGLEYPVVILWDSRGDWDTRGFTPAWAIDRETRAWALKVDSGPDWEDPPGGNFRTREKAYRDHERRRLVYVAATRAREKLVITTSKEGRYVSTDLAAKSNVAQVEKRVRRWEVFTEEPKKVWPAPSTRPSREARGEEGEADDSSLDERIAGAWKSALAEAGLARFRRIAVSALAKGKGAEAASGTGEVVLIDGGADTETETEEDREPPEVQPRRIGRFGPIFGDTVHRALGLALERKLDARVAVVRAAREMGLSTNVDDAIADVERTLECLRREGLVEGTYRLEYPIAGDESGADGAGFLVGGSIDLLCADGRGLVVIDFKTDRAPAEGTRVEATHPAYLAQVAAYSRMLERSGVAAGKTVRRGLLFTVKGAIWWV